MRISSRRSTFRRAPRRWRAALLAVLLATVLCASGAVLGRSTALDACATLTTIRKAIAGGAAAATLQRTARRRSAGKTRLAELTLVMRMTTKFETEYREKFLRSLRLFWPLDDLHEVLIVLDEENREDQAAAPVLAAELEEAGVPGRVVFEPPSDVYTTPGHVLGWHGRGTGYDRMMRSAFWADEYVRSENVAFVDSDAVFVTRVTEGDLFPGGKPVQVGFVGAQDDVVWELACASTHWFLGNMNQSLRGMAAYPYMYYTRHLAPLRAHVEAQHGGKPFDEVYREMVARKNLDGWHYFQCNIISSYLHHAFAGDYEFRLQETKRGWRGPPIDGCVTDVGSLLTQENTAPVVRVTVHWDYQEDKTHVGFCQALRQGYCMSRHAELGFNRTAVAEADPRCSAALWPEADRYVGKADDPEMPLQTTMFDFEPWQSWRWDDRCKAAQDAHYRRVAAGPPHAWNQELLDEVWKCMPGTITSGHFTV